MTHIFHFLLQHPFLSGGLALLGGLLLINEWVASQSTKNQLNTQEVIQMMNHHQAVLIDIRDKESFQSAHILGALSFPKAQLEEKLSSFNQYKSHSVVVMCGMGNEARKMVQTLKSEGFDQVYYLSGGMMAWQKDNLPVLKGSL